MNFEPTDRAKEFADRLEAFMEEEVYPAETVYRQQLA